MPIDQLADRSVLPILKWPGGKRWFVMNHAELLPSAFGRYIEPFLGSGAVYFSVRPRHATLGDTNPDLIAVYKGIKRDWQAVDRLLRQHQRLHGRDHYYAVRDASPTDPAARAARIIYLNRTCFNGIYRVNRQGKFNVPKGDRDSFLYDTDDFRKAARILAGARLCVSDFEPLIDAATAADLVFADPPYTVRHNQNAFIKYNETLFSWGDQVRLADALSRARNQGAKVLSTNANHDSVQQLYLERGFTLRTVSRYSPISADSGRRKQFEELVISANCGSGAHGNVKAESSGSG